MVRYVTEFARAFERGVRSRYGPVLRVAFACALLLGIGVGTRLPAEAATNSCYLATSAAAHVLCWLDFTGYGGTGAQTFTILTPDGSTLTGTVTNTSGTTTGAPVASPAYTTSAYGGVAFGDEDYLGVGGKPLFYPAAGVNLTIQLSAMTLKDAQGTTLPSVTIAGADAESTDSGDGTNGSIGWTTTGTNLAQLQLMPNPAGSTANVCTLTGTGSTSATCKQNGSGPPNAAYILSSTLTNAQTFGMTTVTTAKQAAAFALELASLTVAKTVASRVASSDQFTVQITRAGTTLYSASTSGTGTTAAVTGVVVPTDAYVLKDVTTSGSTPISQYASTVTCTNATAGSTTTLPAAGTSAQSVNVTPAPDDQITCTFTNNALSLTDTAVNPTKTVTAGTSTTDSFTLKNTSAISGTFNIVAPTITTASGASVTPSGYTFNGTTYTTLAALQAAINAAGPTAAGGTITVGVTYAVPGNGGASATVTLPATISSGTGTSAQATASEVDTITPVANLTVAKTGTTTASPGGLIAYSVVVGNSGPSPANGATFSDPVPTGLTIAGTPTCGAATGGAACGPVTVAGQTVSSTITTLPSGGSVTFTIDATAGTGTSYTNTASATPPSGTNGGTVTSSLTTTVAVANGLQKTVANLTSGTAAATADTAKPGDTLRYVLTFTNTTGAALGSLAFSDVVPANTGFVQAQCPAPSTLLPTGITCSATSPAVGSTGTTVKFTFTGSVANNATVTAAIDVKVL